MRLAIGHDLIPRHTDGNPQSFSAMWKAQADETAIEAEVIDPLLPVLSLLIGDYDAFIWRYCPRQTFDRCGSADHGVAGG